MSDIPADILTEMYGLSAEQIALWNRLAALVDEALDQYSKGFAVDVEQQMADLAKDLLPRTDTPSNTSS